MNRKVYGYPKCSTCRKAQKYLNDQDLAYEIIDITQQPPSLKELKGMLATYEGNIKKLLNTSGQVYRAMGLSQKLPTMQDDEVLDLLAKEGKLVKRPFLIVDKQPKCVGFKEEEWAKALA